MPLNSIKQYTDSIESGNIWESYYFKYGTPTISQGRWQDMSMYSGFPRQQLYTGVPGKATQLINNGDSNFSFYTGPNPPSGLQKYLHSLSIGSSNQSGATSTYLLCDYLLYYPFLDFTVPVETLKYTLDNTLPLPRYTDGDGVMCFIVVRQSVGDTVSATIRTCTIEYINSDGQLKTSTIFLSVNAIPGSICNYPDSITAISGAHSPFITLAFPDRGIRSIQSISISSPGGGSGALGVQLTLVLVKPLTQISLQTNLAETEKTFFINGESNPIIQNGAFLNFLMCNGTSSGGNIGIIRSRSSFTWG